MGKTPPADTIRDGNIKASIWENQSEKGSFFTTPFSKTYEDKDGNLRDTNGFNKGDLLRLAELARSTYSRTHQLQRAAAHDGMSREERVEALVEKQRTQRQNRDQGQDRSH